MAPAAVKQEGGGEAESRFLDCISLPIIRLDEFDQDELRLLAQFSGNFPEAKFHNIVIPKIDRRIFNESAGSRRQTYGKCFASRHWTTSVPDQTSSEEEEREEELEPARSRGRRSRKQQRKVSVAEKKRSAKAVARVIVERKGRLRLRDGGKARVNNEARGQSSGGRKVSWNRRTRHSLAASDTSDDSLWTDSGGNAAKATGSGKRGRAKKLVIEDVSDDDFKPNGSIYNSRKKQKQVTESLVAKEESEEEELGRKFRKRRANTNYELGGSEDRRGNKRRGERVAVVSRRGEIHRKDEGGRVYFGQEELMQTLTKMKGTWSSSQMKRKIVEATGFPKGWTVLVGLRHTSDGRAYFDYRDWRSPDGTVWTSYKEAAAFLLSTVGKDPCFKGVPLPIAGHDDTYEKKALTAEGGGYQEVKCIERDQSLIDTGSLAELMKPHDGQSFAPEITFEMQSQADRSLEEDLELLERGVHAASVGNPHASGDPIDKFLRVSQKADDVAIGTQAFGVQVTAKMDSSTCGADGEESRKFLGTDGRLKVHNIVVNSRNEPVPKKCQTAEATGVRESNGNLIKEEYGGIVNPNPVVVVDAARRATLNSNHEQVHSCQLCDMTFSTLKRLRRHSRRSKHLNCLKCEVCGKKFTTMPLLLGHRVRMDHPRMIKVSPESTRTPAQMPNSKEIAGGAEMSNIGPGLPAATHNYVGLGVDQLSLLNQSTNRLHETARAAGTKTPQVVERIRVESSPVSQELLDGLFECKTCLKVFNRQSKYWGHLSVHSRKKGGVGQGTQKSSKSPRSLPVEDGVYECDICHKSFHHQSKYWGHLSIHSNKRENALTSTSTLHGLQPLRLVSRIVEEPKPSVREPISGSNGVEVSHTTCAKQQFTESVFWKLLEDSLPPEGANHEPVPCREEAVIRPLAPFTKEEAADNGGNLDFRATLDVNVGPASVLLQAKSTSSVFSIHSDNVYNHGLFEQIEANQRIIDEVSVGIENIWKQLSEKPPPIDAGNDACPICLKDDDQPRHLICDWCEKEFHQGCLKPVLQVVSGEWICPLCRSSDLQSP